MNIEQGIYHDMSEADYRAADGINQSHLKLMLQSPYHYANPVAKEPTAAMLLGTRVGMAVLEPDRFSATYLKGIDATKASKAWKEFDAANPDKECLTLDQWEEITGIANAISEHKIAAGLIELSRHEVSVFADYQGFKLKARFDLLGGNFLADLKTTTDITPDAYSRKSEDMNYHFQAASYSHVARLNGLPEMPWFNIVASTTEPYLCAVYQMPKATIERGDQLFKSCLKLLRKCEEENAWPSYTEEIFELPEPKWIPKIPKHLENL